MNLIQKFFSGQKRWIVGVPMAWLLLFLFIPFLYILKISFALPTLSIPPYTDLFAIKDQVIQIHINLKSYVHILHNSAYFISLMQSAKLALLTTLLCILVGYPMAYAIACSDEKTRNIFLIMIILPYWTSFLLRAYAWIALLKNTGIINQFLLNTGLIETPIHMLHTPFAICIGLLYGYLPFFILPLYASLMKIDQRLLEAASDLGCHPVKRFFTITLPLSMPGVISGVMLVFVPAMCEVVIPQLLGGLNTLMIGNVIWQQFFFASNWPLASALAVGILLFVLVPVLLWQRVQSRR